MRIPSKADAPDRATRQERVRESGQTKQAKSQTSASGGVATGGVKATVSARARSLASEHGIDEAKVNRLRELIHSGSFAMDFGLIAQRIVAGG